MCCTAARCLDQCSNKSYFAAKTNESALRNKRQTRNYILDNITTISSRMLGQLHRRNSSVQLRSPKRCRKHALFFTVKNAKQRQKTKRLTGTAGTPNNKMVRPVPPSAFPRPTHEMPKKKTIHTKNNSTTKQKTFCHRKQSHSLDRNWGRQSHHNVGNWNKDH